MAAVVLYMLLAVNVVTILQINEANTERKAVRNLEKAWTALVLNIVGITVYLILPV